MNIVIHAPPRTGGFSVRWYFEQIMKVHCLHVHYLLNRFYYARKSNVWTTIGRTEPEDWKVICTIRDPIARNLSEYWRLNYIDGPGKPRTEMRITRGLRKRDGTNAEKFQAYIDHYRQHHFLGGELVPFWGINIFEEQEFKPPYTIYDKRLLIIRCEDLSEHGNQAMYELTGLQSDEPFPHRNVVPTKRDPIALSEAYINAMYKDEWFPKWFYSDNEIELMKDKWKQTIDTGTT